ncbi:MAG: helix-turn-helix domain-containing protein [Bacteroidetes bacterium]|nr:MAG: helix-turn-helix domain-containing protein [Bacteroidota bacterium]
MLVNKQNIRLIFGLKLKQLRQQRGLSFAELSKAAGLSVSYLNEIEKGKKYPKAEKIIALASALDVSYDQLVSLKLSRKLAPVADLLHSGILDSLPLELFGLEASTLLDIISSAPTQVNAFISTLVKIARSYELTQENFYFAALRSYQEMHDNYFEDLEAEVETFVEEQSSQGANLRPAVLMTVLHKTYGYTINREALQEQPELRRFRSVFSPKDKVLYINDSLTDMQQAFLLGKEIAFNRLSLTERPYTSTIFHVNSFEEVLSNFKASYFSVALLMNRHHFLKDLTTFFDRPEWDPEAFLALMDKYRATPEMFLHRLTNLLPKYFGIDHFFFLRFQDQLDREDMYVHITKELHLSRLHNPHRNDLNQHYCRRWVSVRVLSDLRAQSPASKLLVDIQRSHYTGTKNEYLCITIARPNTPTPHANVSVTLGIQVDAASRRRIRFLEHPDIPLREVGETCERCPLIDCEARVAPPSVVDRQQEDDAIRTHLEALIRK